MFDVIAGLPVHALVLHVAVVGLPLMALVTFLVTARARWRPALVWVIVADALVFLATFVTVESGEALQGRLSAAAGQVVAEEHGEEGKLLIPLALALLISAGLAYFLLRRGPGATTAVAIALVAVAAIAVTAWTVVVGHSGASAVWKDTIANTSAPAGGS